MKRHTCTLHNTERALFFLACSILIAVFAAYIYLVSASVVHVVVRKEVSKEISYMSSHISELEAEYIAAQHSVSADIASMQGYEVTDKKIFIDRTDTTLVLSTNNDG